MHRAYTYSFINDKEKAGFNLKHAIDLDSSYKEIAENESGFKELWTDEEFKKLLNRTK